jgi:hypothetical protein
MNACIKIYKYNTAVVTQFNTVACRDVSRQRLCKNFPATIDTHATIEVLLETVFSTRSVPRCYKRDGLEQPVEIRSFGVHTRVEAGSNISTVALLVLRGDENEHNAWGYNWATLFLGDINAGNLALQVEGVSNLRQ